MKTILNYLPSGIAVFFALLFGYAAFSKGMDFQNFQVQLAQSPLLSAWAGLVSYAVIIVEMVVVLLLCFDRTRLLGLHASFGLMVAFTVYITLILNYSDFVPCSCGGVLEKMTWDQHLIFNIICVLMALTAIILMEKESKRSWSRPVAWLTLTALFSAGGMVALFISSEHMMKKANNFTRRFIQQPFEKEKSMDLGANSYYFAGADKDYIYLGNHTAPQIITIIDTQLRLKKEMKISVDPDSIAFRSARIEVHPPYFFVYDGSVPVIFRGMTDDFKAQLFSKDDAYFTQITVIDSNRIAFKSQNSQTQKRTLGVFDIRSKPKVRLNGEALGDQRTGMFASDGVLLYDASYKQLIYTFFYKNPVVIMDERLRVKSRYRTIDTVTTAMVGEIALKNGLRKMSVPPLVVNKRMSVERGTLFNESNLIGRHEDRKVWENASVIDLYATDKPLYKGSIYIFTGGKGRTKMSHFLVHGKALYALAENTLIQFPFSARLTDKLKNGEAENH